MYIRETSSSLQKRIAEHKYAVKRCDRKNSVAVHAWDHEHRVDWEGVKILESEPHHLKRRVIEAIWIHRTKNNSNLTKDCGLTQTKSGYLTLNETVSSLHSFSYCLSPSCLYIPIAIVCHSYFLPFHIYCATFLSADKGLCDRNVLTLLLLLLLFAMSSSISQNFN